MTIAFAMPHAATALASSLLPPLERWCAPWQSLYADSKTVSTTITAVHIVALLVGGGLAIAADRTTLRLVRVGGDTVRRREQLAELRAVHRPVIVALALLFASGVALAAADVETFAGSPTFWVKLGLVGLLCLNGLVMQRTEHSLGAPRVDGRTEFALWRRLASVSRVSLGLWIATALAGTILTSAA